MTPRETKAYRSGYPNDLRDERWQEALSGPVVTYKAIEELVPSKWHGGIYVTFHGSSSRCLYISRQATDWILQRANHVRLRIDNVKRTLIITPDPYGPWTLTVDKGAGLLGAARLRHELIQRGFQPGRYEARVVGESLVVELGGHR